LSPLILASTSTTPSDFWRASGRRKFRRYQISWQRQCGLFRSWVVGHRLSAAAVLVCVALLSGCRQDMHDQPRMKPLRRNDFFEDAREGRPLIAGTVYRNQTNIAGPFIEDVYFLTGMEAPNRPGNRLPFPLTADALRRGQERYNIYCSPCHSRIGDGNGMIVQRGYRHPPSYHTDVLRNSPLGHFFDVMTNGFGAMPDYAQQLSPADRW